MGNRQQVSDGVFTPDDGGWDEPSLVPQSHPTYWEDFPQSLTLGNPESSVRPPRSWQLAGGALRTQIMRRDNYACVECGMTWDLQIDHIRPVSRGGTDEPDNLQVLCRDCNRKKGARWRVNQETPHQSNSMQSSLADPAL